jgi:hypothetical protein
MDRSLSLLAIIGRARQNRQGKRLLTVRKVAVAIAAGIVLPLLWAGWGGSIGQAAASHQPALASPAKQHGGLVERGRIVGWPGGNAVIYPTVGFFGTSQIFAVGAVHPDGSFTVHFPTVLPVDLLHKSTDQCSTLHSSDPAALNNFTGNYLIVQHGTQVGATHSATSQAFASFTGGASGDTRTGFLYTNRTTTLSGYCQRTITLGGYSVDFRQNFNIHAHKGWNEVVASLSIPQPGHLVSNLTVGSNRAREKWFFFRPAMEP